MMATDRATTREADQRTGRGYRGADCGRAKSAGEMALQSSRGFEAAPQTFVRLTGSHLARPRASRAVVSE
ncbi:hypothetical protein [Bradyrhizobium sp. CCGE-LA001]|uniref:hypothetical protein n=1 Tax=Bradyrhizobium sp. CCGE-LA001 TaxID=1223566 RepID=UPI000303A977|nr:hypothetical protein [Bradyrhizobium sp. CCGE-LA001]AMA61305.1 hypothetical protein BCCGELA001_17325 [Bradyrhizobium sp. CCGE-LA001]